MSPTAQIIKIFLKFLFFLLLAQTMFCVGLPGKNKFVLRAVLSVVACFVATALFGLFGAILLAGFKYNRILSIAVNIVLHIVVFVLVFAAMTVCFKKKKSSCLFLSTASYAVQDIAISIPVPVSEWVSPLLHGVVEILVICTTYAVAYFLFVRRFNRLFSEVGELKWNSVLLFSVFIILIATVVGSVGYHYSSDSKGLYAMFTVCVVSFCAFLLYAQYLILGTARARRDSLIEKSLREVELKQYEFMKNNIDSINIRFHDIKHQIGKIKQGENTSGEYLDKLAELMDEYDAQIKTGNEELDVILFEKSLLCKHKKIRFVCLADGKLLGGMEAYDLYSLFGNAIDNAVEYLETVSEDKRIIKVFVKEYGGGFASISVKNYYEGNDGVMDEMATTKADRENHGFGIRSMKRIAEKYGGRFGIFAKDGVFSVNIVLPLPVSQVE